MGNDVLSWSDFENMSAADVLGNHGAYSDYGTYTSNSLGILGAKYNETTQRSSVTGTVTVTTSGSLGPLSIDNNGVISLSKGASIGPARTSVSIDGTGTVTSQVGVGAGIDTGLVEFDTETGDYHLVSWFGTLLSMPKALIASVGAHAQARVDEAIRNASGLCFERRTLIAKVNGSQCPISDIRVGDTVLAFDPSADLGRGALVPRKVVRLYRNTTEEWVKLTWAEGGEAKELTATPDHHFLDRFGSFPTIEEMLENGRATVVLASGELTEVAAERIIYRADSICKCNG
jgi:hypothetical protein